MVFNMQENIKKVLYWEDTPQTKIIKKAYDLGLVGEEVLEKVLNDDSIEKALKGIYGDTYQNRMLGRVGQKFDYTLSAYTIASNCTDPYDCEVGLEEIKKVMDKAVQVPRSVYIKYYKLSEKLDKLKKQEYARISKQADRIITGEEYIERLSPSEEEGRVRGGKRNVEATLLLRGEEVTSDEDGFRVEELIRKQEKILKDYAKETGIWVDRDIIEKDWLFVDKGEEAKVYDDGNYIKKVFDYQFFSLSPLEFIDNRISLHNFMFEETSYELIGFTETNRGLSFILRQPYIQNYSKTPVSVIREEMVNNGFNVMDEKSYYNNNYIVEDLHHKNVLTNDTTGKLYFIDTVVSLNEEGEGYGGKRKYNKIRVTSKTIEKSLNNISELYLKGVIDDETFQKAEELYIEKAKKANIGEIRVWSGKRMKKISDKEWRRVDENEEKRDDFLYNLKSEYVIDFDKKNKNVFLNFYRNYPNEILDDLFVNKTIANLSNNLDESVVEHISKTQFILSNKSKYESESVGYWVGAFDESYNQINLNKDIYSEFSGDYYGQEQLLRVNLHEIGHKLYRDNLIDSETLFSLWETGERVSKQSRLDYEENFCELFAATLIALSDQGDTEDNTELSWVREDAPKSLDILLPIIKSLKYEK